MKYPINPDRSLPWNDLPMLPISNKIYEDREVLIALGKAKQALALLHGRSSVIPNQGLLISTISLQEAKSSSEIENIFTTTDELYKAFSDNKEDVKGASKEVLRYREALWTGYNFLQKQKEFSVDYFIKVFQEIKQTADTIRPPFLSTVIRKGGSGITAGEIVYTPPRGKDIILEKLNNLIHYLNDDEDSTDPLIKMAIAHFQFEAIHPFRDGNGRTGRILNIHYLVNKGLLNYPILYLSRYILKHKEEYYENLEAISQRGKWKEWILFILRAVETTSHDTFIKINEISELKDNILKYLDELNKYQNPYKLVELIFTQPYTKVQHFTDQKIYAERTARKYLNELCEHQILELKIIQGNHYYLNMGLYDILSR